MRDNYTIGVEEEYMLCSPHDGELVSRADEIINSLNSEMLKRYSYELILSEIEINTSVCKSVDEALEEIIFLRNNTKNIGEKYDFKIGISGALSLIKCDIEKPTIKGKLYTVTILMIAVYDIDSAVSPFASLVIIS